MARGTKVTKSVFECGKILFKGGATNKEVMDFLHLSNETVRRLKNAETYEEYLQISYSLSGTGYKRRKAAEAKAAAEKEAKKAEAEKVAEKVGAVPASRIITIPDPTQQKPVSMTIQATHYMETKLDKCIELLTGISAKLACIIDDLYGTKGADNSDAGR